MCIVHSTLRDATAHSQNVGKQLNRTRAQYIYDYKRQNKTKL